MIVPFNILVNRNRWAIIGCKIIELLLPKLLGRYDIVGKTPTIFATNVELNHKSSSHCNFS